MVSLVETLEPATTATSGRAGWPRARVRASISAAISGPAQATGAKRAMPPHLGTTGEADRRINEIRDPPGSGFDKFPNPLHKAAT